MRSTLRPMSEKVIREIQQGKRDTNGRKKVNAVEAWAIAKARDEKQREAIYGKTKPIQIDRDDAIKLLDNVFSQYIRLRDTDEQGYLNCFICEVRLHWTRAENMHFMPRTAMPTRFDEIACQGGCTWCNDKPNGDREQFAARLDSKYGNGTAEVLRKKSKNTSQNFKTKQILDLLTTYRDHVARIRKAHPGKFIKP